MGCGSSRQERNAARQHVVGDPESTVTHIPAGTGVAETRAVSEEAALQAKAADNKCNSILATHLSALLDLQPVSSDVVRYVAALRSEGFDTPIYFNRLTVDELKEAPFNFKRGHLLQVCALGCRCIMSSAAGVGARVGGCAHAFA